MFADTVAGVDDRFATVGGRTLDGGEAERKISIKVILFFLFLCEMYESKKNQNKNR